MYNMKCTESRGNAGDAKQGSIAASGIFDAGNGAKFAATMSRDKLMGLMATIATIDSNICMEADASGIRGKTTDYGHARLVSVDVPSGSMRMHEAPSEALGFQIDAKRALAELKDGFDKNEDVTVMIEDGSIFLAGKGRERHDITDMYGEKCNTEDPVYCTTAELVASGTAMLKNIGAVGIVSPYAKFHCIDGMLVLAGNNDKANACVNTEMHVEGTGKNQYPTDYLKAALKAAGNADVKLMFGDNMPLRLEWEHITYWISPYMRCTVVDDSIVEKRHNADAKIVLKMGNKEWLNMLVATGDLAETVAVMVDQDGMRYNTMDPTHVGMIQVDCPKSAFLEYSVPAGSFCFTLDVDDAVRMMKRFGRNETVAVGTDGDGTVFVSAAGHNYRMKTQDEKEYRKCPHIPYEFSAKAALNVNNVQRMLNAIKSVPGTARAGHNDKNGVPASEKSVEISIGGGLRIEGLNGEGSFEAACDSNGSDAGKYSMDYLSGVLKGVGGTLRIFLGHEWGPAKLEWRHATYWVAPRIER